MLVNKVVTLFVYLIAGYGYVGQAMEELFKDYHEIIISDPK